VTPWTLTYDGFDPASERLREALCTLGNGYFATRGAAPEAAAGDVHYPGTYVAGCYNRAVSRVGGREVENEDLVNLPNWLPLTFRAQGGDWLDLSRQEVLGLRQELDDLEGRHLAPVAGGRAGDDSVWLLVETRASRVQVALAARTRVAGEDGPLAAERRFLEEPGLVAEELATDAHAGQAITAEKVVALFTSRDRAVAEAGDAARGRVARLPDGFDQLLERHTLAWDQLWRRCRIDLGGDGDPEVARALNLHVFHLLQTVSEHTIDLDVGVPARGLHGEAYRGHIFWDELFVFPFLNLRFPELTRALLRYRARRLPEARHAARAAGYQGAMYPWQSGSDGREETQRLHLNPRSGRCPTSPTASATSTRPWPGTSGSTTRPPATWPS
jgi:trehalose/maltose hydrolase-like predicted phosphorylase